MVAKDKIKKVIEEDIEYSSSYADNKTELIESLFDKIPRQQLEKIKNYLLDDVMLEILRDKDLMACVEGFWNNNLNISETSRNAFLHRNTLIYRIDKIYKATGFNIKNFNDAVTFKILLMIYNKFYR